MEKRRAAVTGIGVVSPLANSAPALYRALKENRSGIRAMTEWHDHFGRNIAGAPVYREAVVFGRDFDAVSAQIVYDVARQRNAPFRSVYCQMHS